MKYFFAAVAFLLSFNTFADTLQFCSATSVASSSAGISPSITTTLVSTSTIAPGACTPTPPPASCVSILKPVSGVYTRWTGTRAINFCPGGCTKQADVTLFDSIYGKWPGAQYGIIGYFQLPVSNYLSAQFTVPQGYLPPPTSSPIYGAYKIGETGADTTQGMTISTRCGDFSNPSIFGSTVVPGCWKNRSTSSSNLLSWRSNNACVLRNGVTYYLNVINADISTVQPTGTGNAPSTKNGNCASASCQVPIMDGPGNWTNP